MLTGCIGDQSGGQPTLERATPASQEDGATARETGTAGPEVLPRGDAEAALRSTGNFTATWRYNGSNAPGHERAIRYEFRADVDAKRGRITFSHRDPSDGGTWGGEMFGVDDTTYTRLGRGANASYVTNARQLNVSELSLNRVVIYQRNVRGLERVGRATHHGVPVTRYELTRADADLWPLRGATGTSPEDLTGVHVAYVVLVDDDGLVRFESWSFTGTNSDGEPASGSWGYELTAVGSTNVDDPAWLDDAKAQSE